MKEIYRCLEIWGISQISVAVADTLPTLIALARITREFEDVMPQLVDKEE